MGVDTNWVIIWEERKNNTYKIESTSKRIQKYTDYYIKYVSVSVRLCDNRKNLKTQFELISKMISPHSSALSFP